MAYGQEGITEKLFQSIGGPSTQVYNPRRGNYDTDEYAYRIRMLIEDSRMFNDEQSAPKREKAMRYYDAIEPYLDEQGRSTIVSTDTRDTILAMMPSLMRIFTAQENMVEYTPTNESMEDQAEQATDYISHLWWEDNPGFITCYAILKDALTKAMGIVRWWTDDNKTVIERSYTNLSPEQYQYVAAQPHTEIVEFKAGKDATPEEPAYDCKVRITEVKPLQKIEAVPPDEFRIDRYAKSVEKATLVGQEQVVQPWVLVGMGYDQTLVNAFRGSHYASVRWNQERSLRNPGSDEGAGGPDINDGVLYGEYYIRIDSDGDGIAELHHICVMGDEDVIVHDEVTDYTPMAMLCPDLEPHTAIGHSISELVMDIQKIKTNIIRNTLDSLAAVIYPRTVVDDTVVNMDDVLNTEVGAPIRSRDVNAVKPLVSQFIGDQIMGVVNYMDQIKQSRTGISEASKGLDPDALQSTTVKGVNMIVTGAQERIELVARILAETGFKDIFKGLLREVTNNPCPSRVIKLRGKWVTVVPDAFDPSMGVRVNPAIGRGSDMDRLMILTKIKETQEMIMQTQGVSNPMVSPAEYRNTLQDILQLAGVKNVGRYFKAIDPQVLAQKAAAPPPPNPATMLAANEQEKTKLQAVKETATLSQNRSKQVADDNFKRDKLRVDSMLKAKELELKYGGAVDLKTIEMMIEHDRMEHESQQNELDRQHQIEVAQTPPPAAPTVNGAGNA